MRIRPSFDPGARYVAARHMAVAGRALHPGDEIAGVTDRLRKRLFDLRRIVPAPAPERVGGKALSDAVVRNIQKLREKL